MYKRKRSRTLKHGEKHFRKAFTEYASEEFQFNLLMKLHKNKKVFWKLKSTEWWNLNHFLFFVSFIRRSHSMDRQGTKSKRKTCIWVTNFKTIFLSAVFNLWRSQLLSVEKFLATSANHSCTATRLDFRRFLMSGQSSPPEESRGARAHLPNSGW